MSSVSIDRINGSRSSLAFKAPCLVATTANLTNLSGLLTVDGVVLVDGDRVLVKNQTVGSANGIYIADTGDWSRAPDMNGNLDVTTGTMVLVVSGAMNAYQFWGITTTGTITIGTTSITFALTLINSSGLITFIQAGTGAVATDAQSKMREIVHFEDNGIYGGGSDESTKINQLFANWPGRQIVGGTAIYGMGTTALLLPAKPNFRGQGRNATVFNFNQGGVCVDGFTAGCSDLSMQGFGVTMTANAAIGMKFGASCQHLYLPDIAITGNQAAANTGTALLLDATSGTNAFSGHLLALMFYALGNKYGVRCVGQTSVKTWTTMSFLQSFLIGRSTGIIVGSAGIYMDSLTNGTGSQFKGGTIESFDYGAYFEDGCLGMEMECDIEACNTLFRLSNSFTGKVDLNAASYRLDRAANGTSNYWSYFNSRNGIIQEDAYYSRKFTIRHAGAAAPVGFDIDIGTPASEGGTPIAGAGLKTNGSFATPDVTYKYFGSHNYSWGSGKPSAGAWAVADFVRTTAATGPREWFNISAGSPGTFVAHTKYGTFTCANAAATTVNDTDVTATSAIVLVPTNAAAATLMSGATALYMSARTAQTSFAFTTANAAAAAGTETFAYMIIN